MGCGSAPPKGSVAAVDNSVIARAPKLHSEQSISTTFNRTALWGAARGRQRAFVLRGRGCLIRREDQAARITPGGITSLRSANPKNGQRGCYPASPAGGRRAPMSQERLIIR